MKQPHEDIKKITANLPASLIERAMEGSGLGVTDTLKIALKEYNHRWACGELRKLRGKIKFDLTYEEMKEDRE